MIPYLVFALERYQDNSEGLLFYDTVHGKMISTQQVNCFYGRVCKKLGIENNGQHSLRHTYATRAVEAGINPNILKTWMGHSDIHITMDTYADASAMMQNSETALLDAYYKRIR